MKIECQKASLTNSLRRISARSTLTLVAMDTQLILVAKDEDTSIRWQIDAIVHESGMARLEVRALNQYLKTLPEGPVLLEESSLPEEPTVSLGRVIHTTSLNPTILKNLRKLVSFAAARPGPITRPLLCSVTMQVERDVMLLISADGFRLVSRAIKLDQSFAGPYEAIIPITSINALVRLMPGQKDMVRVVFYRDYIRFELDRFSLTAKLIDGIFPGYSYLLREVSTTCSIINREEFLKILQSFEENHLKAIIDKDRFMVCPIKSEDGFTLAGVKTEGEPLEIGFSSEYMQDFLKATVEPDIILSTRGPYYNMTLKPAKDDSYVYHLMPVHLSSQF